MAFQAKRSYVLEITFSAAFDDGNDMIGVPEALSAGRSEPESPFQSSLQAGRATQSLKVSPGCQTVDATLGAHASVAL
jgi:hypothetical protein